MNSSLIFAKLKRLFKFLFILFIIALLLLNALLVNIYSNILVSLRGEPDQASVENIRISSSPSSTRWLPAAVPVGGSRSASQVISNFTFTSEDYRKLLNISDFQFLLNHVDICNNSTTSEEPLFMIIFVHSASKNFAKREAIRKTWANPSNLQQGHNTIRVIFLLGTSTNTSHWPLVEEEDRLHNDIIMGNFVDSYRNLTYKHIMGLKWVNYHCREAQYVFKADDDIFVDLRQLTFYLKGTFGDAPERLIACYLNKNSLANRSWRNKWRVTFEEYSQRYYPKYCSGWGIIMSPDVVLQLYNATQNRPYFWIDDVFISGIVARDLKIAHTDLGDRVTIDYEHVDKWLQSSELSLPPIFGFPDSATSQIYSLWNKTSQYYSRKAETAQRLN